ncbi:MAG TPA: bifunctional UDP-sugar hydrolase/5'-nucleotidase [bacterium]|nr:bifunctional UDP-sugar hydrolase/5'-nucleotidase [bacterium]
MKSTCAISLLAALLAAGCLGESYGTAPEDPATPRELVLLHTTDSHSKYFPFWIQPNMFDRAMGISSRNPHCWDLDWAGGAAWCDGAWIAEKGRFKFWEDGDYIYLTEEEMTARKLVSEDVNRDGTCDIHDCGIVWDRDRDGTCSFPYDTATGSYRAADGTVIDPADRIAFTAARNASEDVDRNGRCDDLDYRPELASTGGVARIATILRRIREERAAFPVIHIDTGDAFQGAPQFNLFRGEVEMRALAELGIDAMVIGNHEFDNGTRFLVEAYERSGGFPLLASNYLFDDRVSTGLAGILQPFIILHRGSLRIGVVGIGNDSSMTSMSDIGNKLGFYGLDPVETAKLYVGLIRAQCDIVVIASHQGLEGDYELAAQVPGVDIILGGHHHVVLDPPKVLTGPDGREVLIVHSGVDLKIVGELRVIVKDGRVAWHAYTVHPNTDAVAEDPAMTHALQPYQESLRLTQDLTTVVGYAKNMIRRTDPNGGDSPLGNLVTDAMMRHELVRAEIAVTNSLGIRADIPAGDIRREKLYEVFPFENTITTMYLSGRELKDMFDYIARRSASRGCVTQVQVAGLSVELDCSADTDLQERYNSYALTKELRIGDATVIADYELKLPHTLFKMATNDYMARGGSGFDMLLRNTTRIDTSIPIRDALVDLMREQGEIDPADFSSEKTGVRRITMRN